MSLFDVIFPLNLGPLTYTAPPGLSPGMLVSAEVKKTLKRGVILRQTDKGPTGKVKPISSVIGPLLSNAMLNLISWMSEYYFAKEGIVLKEFLAPEIIGHLAIGHVEDTLQDRAISPGTYNGPLDFESIARQIKKKSYKTFLLHAPSSVYISSLIEWFVRYNRNILVLCPEIAWAEQTAADLNETARVSVLHSGLSLKLRRQAVERILTGQSDVVIGSRSSVFAPMKDISLIVVQAEESPSYKKEDGLKYHMRDVAVMRGYLEGATVVLASICPSVDSYYNALRGKYTLIRPAEDHKRPRVKIIDMRSARKVTPFISKELIDKAVSRHVGLLINRRGYSLLECEDCGHIETCSNCSIPLVFHKKDRALKCHYCGLSMAAGDSCRLCGGHNIRSVGAGVERVEEDIRTLLRTEPLRLEGRRPTVPRKLSARVIIGTKLIAKMPELKGRFSLIGVLNGDSYLHVPDFRSTERAFTEFLYLTEKLAGGGELFIQSRMPYQPLFKYIRGYDFEKFYTDELRTRKAFLYPPFARTALIALNPTGSGRRLYSLKGAQVLGPVEALSKRGKRVMKLFVKACSREELRKAIKALRRNLGDKEKVEIDIDPISI